MQTNGTMHSNSERDVIDNPLFDTFVIAASTTTGNKIVLFSDPISGTKGPERTNLTRPYQLGAGERFRVHAMRVVFVGCLKADIENFMKNFTFRLFVNNKVYLDAPCDYFAGGAGIFGSTNETGGLVYSNGMPDPRAVAAVSADNPIVIGEGSTFRVEANGTAFNTAATVGVFCRVYLDGVHHRLVQ
jgi:hypothetical protein